MCRLGVRGICEVPIQKVEHSLPMAYGQGCFLLMRRKPKALKAVFKLAFKPIDALYYDSCDKKVAAKK